MSNFIIDITYLPITHTTTQATSYKMYQNSLAVPPKRKHLCSLGRVLGSYSAQALAYAAKKLCTSNFLCTVTTQFTP